MIEDLFKKVKQMFTGDKATGDKATGNKKKGEVKKPAVDFKSVLSQIGDEIKSVLGHAEEEISKSINNKFRTRRIWRNKKVILLSEEPDYSVAQVCNLFKGDVKVLTMDEYEKNGKEEHPIQREEHKKSKKYANHENAQELEAAQTDDTPKKKNSQEENILVVTKEWNEKCERLAKDGEFTSIQFLTEKTEVEKDIEHYFLGNINSHFANALASYARHRSKVVGFSGTKSHYDRGRTVVSSSFLPKVLTKKSDENMDDQAFLKKMKDGEINFDDIIFILNKTNELSSHPIMSKLGFKLTDDHRKQINQQKSIIYSMTPKERNDYTLLDDSRIARIAKGAGVDEKRVMTLIEMIKTLKNKSGDLAKMASDPTQLSKLMQTFSNMTNK